MRALDGLDLRAEPGEVHGFLGPNGAGKSTTLRVLLGLSRPDAGTVTVLGQDPWRDAVDLHRRLAYVPGDVSLWPTPQVPAEALALAPLATMTASAVAVLSAAVVAYRRRDLA